MTDACPVCGGGDIEAQAPYRGTHLAFAGLQRTLCRACGMVFANPMPGEGVLEEYNSSYFSTAHGDKPRSRTAVAFFSGIARLRLTHVESYLRKRNIQVARLLELGPGPGFFAQAWLKKFPATAYYANETDASCHAALKRLGVRLVGDSTARIAEPTIDLVVMSHVLEHVPRPLEFLLDAAAGLREGGVLFIEVPCRDFEHKPVDEPHVLFFDKEPLRRLLQRAGFDNIELSYHGLPIERLWAPSTLQMVLKAARIRLVANLLLAPFLPVPKGMEGLEATERAVIGPFKAHCESPDPAWWLRALATRRPA